MKRVTQISSLVMALMIIASCSGGKERAAEIKTPSKPSADTATSKATPANQLCSLFTPAEIEALLGANVGEGHVAGPMNSACQWDGDSASDEAVNAQIQLINDTRYWEKHTTAKGYEVLHGIGKEAFVATSMFGGWEAGALTDKGVVYASLTGGSAGRDTAVRLLRETLVRLGVK